MDPYESPKHFDEDETFGNPTNHRHYELILKMVLWDEPKEKIDQKLRTNKVPPAVAEQIFNHARDERIALIRSEYLKKLILGLILLGAAAATFIGCWFGLHFIPRALLYACFVASAVGLWRVVDGTTGFCMAEKKRGSVADEI